MKNLVRVLLCFTLALSIGLVLPSGLQTAAAAEEMEISVLLNGQLLEFDQSPIIENDRTLVPMRAIFEALGASVSWIEESQTIIAQRDDTFFTLQIGNNTAFINGESMILDADPIIVNDRTLVPVRFIAESLGAKVDWDEANRCVVITGELTPGKDQGPELSFGQQIKAIRTAPDAEKVVMTINGVPVTKKQLETYKLNYSEIGLSEQEAEDSFISEKLLSIQAVREGYTVSEEEIDQTIASVKLIMESDDEFNIFLKDAGMTEDEYWQEARESIKDSLLISKLFEKLWNDYQKANGSLSEQELYEGYAVYYEKYTENLKAEAKIVYME